WNGDDLSYLNTAEVFDPMYERWSVTGSLFFGREDHSATLLQDGKVLVAGGGTVEGNYFGEPLASTELYDPNTENWYSVGPLQRGRQAHSATLLPNGKVLVAGGIYLYREMLGGTELW